MVSFPHMTKSWNIVLPLLMVSLFGFGCLQIGPRIVKAPEPQYAERPSTDQTVALAYVRLDGSQGTITRGSATLPAQDGAELVSGDRVQVSSGTMTVVYPEKGASQISTGSDITLLSDSKGAGSVFTEIRLATGKIWTRFEHVFGSDEQFSVAAQGIVATVRGTGFGVSVEKDGVDVQVADHAVEIVPEPMANNIVAPVRVSVGQGLRLKASEIIDITPVAMKAKVRRLTSAERQAVGFAFGAEKLSAEELKKPTRTFQLLNVAPVVPTVDAQRLQLLRDQLIQLKASGFAAPTRQLLPGETAPIRLAPTMTGPTSTVR